MRGVLWEALRVKFVIVSLPGIVAVEGPLRLLCLRSSICVAKGEKQHKCGGRPRVRHRAGWRAPRCEMHYEMHIFTKIDRQNSFSVKNLFPAPRAGMFWLVRRLFEVFLALVRICGV